MPIDLSRALGAADAGIAIYGPDQRLVSCNARYRQLIGALGDDDVVGKSFEDILRAAVARGHYPAARRAPEAWIAEQMRGFRLQRSLVEVEFADGCWYRARHNQDDDGGTVSVLTDFTEARIKEDALRLAERRLAESQSIARIGNWEFNMGTRELWWSDELYRIFGVDPQSFELVEGVFLGFVRANERERVRKALYDAMDARRAVNLVCSLMPPSGAELVVEIRARVETRPDSGDLVFTGTVQDLTEQRRTARALERTEYWLQIVTDHLPVQIAYFDAEQRLNFTNTAGASWFALTPGEMVGRKLAELLGEEDYASRRPYIERVLGGEIVDRREIFTYPDGVTRDIDMTYVPDIEPDGTVRGYLVLAIDISDQVLRDEQLHRAQKLEAIGQLTGGVAHDFNNLLGVIIGNLQLLERDLRGQEKLLRRVTAAEHAAFRGSELTGRLLTFARRQMLQPEIVDLNALVQGMDDMLRRTLGENVEIEVVCCAGLWPVQVDPGQLENALLNLAVNARDALPDGGKLTIETANARLDDAYVHSHPYVAPGQYVMLAVSDTGVGIPKHVMEHMFEPFFTTKTMGKGTGLGLSMIYGFVKQSGGSVNVYSEVGEGTTVRIYLPRAAEGAAARRPRETTTDDERFPAGDETVLVVEDDPALRATAVELLGDLGYRVLEASDGQSALAILDREAEVHLLLTDVIMPGGMSGTALAAEAKKRKPKLNVMLTSGYAPNGAIHRGIAQADTHWISKPYDLGDLARKVRHALDTPPA